MPKFVEIVMSDSDDEVLIVPYVKPPPPVIELIESSSSSEEESISPSKTKRKKKKRLKSSQHLIVENDKLSDIESVVLNSNQNAAQSPPTSTQPENVDLMNPVRLTSCDTVNSESLSGIVNGTNHNKNDGLTEHLIQGQGQSSINAVIRSTSTKESNEEGESMPSIRIAGSSIYESNYSGAVNESCTSTTTAVEVGLVDSGSSVEKQSGTLGGQGKKGSQSKRASLNNNKRSSPKPRISKKQTAIERTNAAISSFLTTLGIYEPSEDPPLAAPKRARKSKKKDLEDVSQDVLVPPPPLSFNDSTLEVETPSKTTSADPQGQRHTSNSEIPPPTPSVTETTSTSTILELSSSNIVTSTPNPLPLPFVSVTHETPRSSKKSQKKRSKRPRTDSSCIGDQHQKLDDITFTEKELEDTTVNIKTNILIGGPVSSKFSSHSQVQLQGLEQEIETGIDNQMSTEYLDETATNITKITGTPDTHISENDLPTPATLVLKDDNSNSNNNATLDRHSKYFVAVCFNCDAMSKDLEKCDGCDIRFSTDVNIISKDWDDDSTTQKDSGILNKEQEPVVSAVKTVTLTNPFGADVNDENSISTPFVPVVTIQNDYIQTANSFDQLPSYLPMNWSPAMVQYYDSILDTDFKLNNIYSKMSDSPDLWKTTEEIFKKPKVNKKVRCLNCNQFGHISRQCMEKRKLPICGLCGQTGHVSNGRGRPCPNLVCLRCGKRQRKLTHGCEACSHLPRCGVCNTGGHIESHCPDKWRRYFSTTVAQDGPNGPLFNGEAPMYRLHMNTFCSNCGYKGHNYYHCRARRNSQYSPNQPRIVTNLPIHLEINPIATKISTPTSSSIREESTILEYNHKSLSSQRSYAEVVASSDLTATANSSQLNQIERTVTIDSSSNDGDLSMKINVVNESTVDSDSGTSVPKSDLSNQNLSKTLRRSTRLVSGRKVLSATRRCLDYPDCQNKPLIGTSCHQMCILPSEHKLMLQAQNEKLVAVITQKHKVEITVLDNQSTVHISGDNHKNAQDDLMAIILQMKNSQTSTAFQFNFDVTTAEPLRSPEIITLDDEDEDINERTSQNSSAQPLPNNIEEDIVKVALLGSEWELIFAQSLDPAGIIQFLTKQFKVNIFVSKEELSVAITNGTVYNRKLAHRNLVYWLESQAANVEYSLQWALDDTSKRRKEKRGSSGGKKRKNRSPHVPGSDERPPKKKKRNKGNNKSKQNKDSLSDSGPHSTPGTVRSNSTNHRQSQLSDTAGNRESDRQRDQEYYNNGARHYSASISSDRGRDQDYNNASSSRSRYFTPEWMLPQQHQIPPPSTRYFDNIDHTRNFDSGHMNREYREHRDRDRGSSSSSSSTYNNNGRGNQNLNSGNGRGSSKKSLLRYYNVAL